MKAGFTTDAAPELLAKHYAPALHLAWHDILLGAGVFGMVARCCPQALYLHVDPFRPAGNCILMKILVDSS